jgi:outer membrane protein
MSSFLQKSILGLLLSLAAWAVAAQETRVGYINYQRITTESAPAKAAQGRLEQEFSKRDKDLVALRDSIKTFSERFEKDAPTLSESQRTSRQKEFADMNREFQRKQRELQEDINGRRNEELLQVLDKAAKAVKQVADAEKYDMVIQELAYQNGKHDLTDKVLKLLNAAK